MFRQFAARLPLLLLALVLGLNTGPYAAARQRAMIAIAHSMLVIAYHMLLRHEPYRELGTKYYDERKRANLANRVMRRLERLGYSVSIAEAAVT